MVPKPRIVGRTFGIETGVYCGGALTALLLPSERLVSVPARSQHWRDTRAAFQGASSRAPDAALLDKAVRALDLLLAALPQPDSPAGRKDLAAALPEHPHAADLWPLAFAKDRRASIEHHYRSAATLAAAVERWSGASETA